MLCLAPICDPGMRVLHFSQGGLFTKYPLSLKGSTGRGCFNGCFCSFMILLKQPGGCSGKGLRKRLSVPCLGR